MLAFQTYCIPFRFRGDSGSSSGCYRGETINSNNSISGVAASNRGGHTPHSSSTGGGVRDGARRITTPVGGGGVGGGVGGGTGGVGGNRRMTNPVDTNVRRMISSGNISLLACLCT